MPREKKVLAVGADVGCSAEEEYGDPKKSSGRISMWDKLDG
jgi:hypothetical protein